MKLYSDFFNLFKNFASQTKNAAINVSNLFQWFFGNAYSIHYRTLKCFVMVNYEWGIRIHVFVFMEDCSFRLRMLQKEKSTEYKHLKNNNIF